MKRAVSGSGLSWTFLLSESALLSSRTLLLLHTVGQLQQECELMRSQGRLMKGGADVLRAEIKSVLSVQIKSNRNSGCGWLHISQVSVVSYCCCHSSTPLWAILGWNFSKNLSGTSFGRTGALFVAIKKSHFDAKVDSKVLAASRKAHFSMFQAMLLAVDVKCGLGSTETSRCCIPRNAWRITKLKKKNLKCKTGDCREAVIETDIFKPKT